MHNASGHIKNILILLLLALPACNTTLSRQPASTAQREISSPSPTVKPTNTPTSTPTPTPTSTHTPTPTQTPTSSPTPTIAFPIAAGTPMPANLQPITIENYDQIQVLAEWDAPFLDPQGNTQSDAVVSAALSADQHWLAIGTSRGSLQIWDFQKRELVKNIETGDLVIALQFLPDSQSIISSPFKGQILSVWKLPEGELITKYQANTNVMDMDVSPDGKTLAVAGDGGMSSGRAELINLEDGALIKRFSTNGFTTQTQFSPDGSQVAFAIPNQELGIWSVPDLKQVMSLYTDTRKNKVYGVSFSPDGSRLISSIYTLTGTQVNYSYQTILAIFDLQTGELVQRIAETNGESIPDILFIPNTDLFVTRGEQGNPISQQIYLYDLQEAKLLKKIGALGEANQYSLRLSAIDVTQDGTMILSVTKSGQIVLWGIGP